MNDNGKHILVPHPKYQREYVYSDKKRDTIIETVIEGFQLGLMYWSKGVIQPKIICKCYVRNAII